MSEALRPAHKSITLLTLLAATIPFIKETIKGFFSSGAGEDAKGCILLNTPGHFVLREEPDETAIPHHTLYIILPPYGDTLWD